MHFYEASIITTKEGLYCQVYSNEHPDGMILVKPKYIPTDRVHSNSLPNRFISGKRMNRLNLWIDKNDLREYLKNFSAAYPDYIFENPLYDESPLFFAVPKENIERIYSPREGLSELMSMSYDCLDEHLKMITEFISFLLKSNLELKDFGITYSTLMGHYYPDKSDINIVVYGKNKFWKLMDFLKQNTHPSLRWKTYEEWEKSYKKRSHQIIHKKEIYIKNMYRKKSEGFFKDTLFTIFAVEDKEETWCKWGEETYKKIGSAKYKATVVDNKNSVVRPGYYQISDSEFIEGDDSCRDLQIDKIVFYSRDYCMLTYPGEEIEASGIIEEVVSKNREKYYRLVIGYFDSYQSERRDKEYIKVLNEEGVKELLEENTSQQPDCNLCRETRYSVGDKTGYGIIIYKVGDFNDGWFAALSPRTGGNPEEDFTIQLMPNRHLTHFSQINGKLAENYGVAFANLNRAMTAILAEENPYFEKTAKIREKATSIAAYGKCTNWEQKKEHLHIKIYPFKGDLGQPSPADSSFGRKETYIDKEGEFIKMKPVKKVPISEERLQELSKRLIELLK